MTSIREPNWAAVSALLDELWDADTQQRAARLQELRTQDPQLVEQVASLLRHQAAVQSERFLEDELFDALSLRSLEGRNVGGYTLEQPLGQGGMGSVWLARRSDGRYEGRAAIKFLNLALLGTRGAERLRREANALARLAHPNITHLLDAGEAAGQPYLVLEYVEGETIDQWCDARGLDVAARVELFLQVLAAVSHAHSRLILHRDIKPSNVLVTAEGCAKLLDFGIARLLEENGRNAANAELTHLGGAFTPGYAAPEQILRTEVTAATDVYSLAVLLYVLLVGRHPLSSVTSTPVEQLQALLETKPLRPSAAALRIDPVRARMRGTSPRRLSKVLEGELDDIIDKALSKSPAERYPTAKAFAGALQRYLENARPSSGAAAPLNLAAGAAERELDPESHDTHFCLAHDGARLAYALTGEGPPLVMVTNWTTHLGRFWSSPIWRHWLQLLSSDHRLVRYDARGIGLSDRHPPTLRFTDSILDLSTVLDAAGVQRAPVLGMGEAVPVAVAHAARYPERVSALILINGNASGWRLKENPKLAQRMEALIQLLRHGWDSPLVTYRQIFSTSSFRNASAEQVAAFNELQRESITPENAAAILSALGDIDVREDAKRVRAPTLILHARGDMTIPIKEGLTLASLIPGARFVPLDSDNHMLTEDEPAWQRFAQELDAFLRGVAA